MLLQGIQLQSALEFIRMRILSQRICVNHQHTQGPPLGPLPLHFHADRNSVRVMIQHHPGEIHHRKNIQKSTWDVVYSIRYCSISPWPDGVGYSRGPSQRKELYKESPVEVCEFRAFHMWRWSALQYTALWNHLT